MTAPITVEFVGHAGSGKSFLREKVVAALSESNQVAGRHRLRFLDLCLFGVRTPGTLSDILRLVLSSRPKNPRWAFTAMLKIVVCQIKMRNAIREGGGTVVFDEGMLHRLRMLREGSRGEGPSYESIDCNIRQRLFSYPDLVVFVVASLETMANRKVARDGTAKTGEGFDEMVRRKRSNYAASLEATERDILEAQREHDFRFLKITNETESSVKENVETILAEIHRLEGRVVNSPNL